MEQNPLKKIEKISIFNVSLNRLSSILQEENNIRKLFNRLTLNFLLMNKEEEEKQQQQQKMQGETHPLNLAIINTDINIVHQSVQEIFWQIHCDQLISSLELSFLLKVNTVENTTLVSVNLTLLNQSVITKAITDKASSMMTEIIEHINNFVNKDEYYRTQIESIIIAVSRQTIWDYITQWKYTNSDKTTTNCFEVKFTNNPSTQGAIIQFLDNHNILRIYNVTLVDDNVNNSQWLYNMTLKEDQSCNFQQVKFVFTLIESNITLVSMESVLNQNVSSEALEMMKQHKKKMLEGIKVTLEGH